MDRDLNLSAHFTLRELTKSATATRHGIENMPGVEEINRLRAVAGHILEPVRGHFDVAFSPSSGYRCRALNDLLRSSPKSQHIQGEAVDFELPGQRNWDVAEWIRDNLVFDQLILEFYKPDEPGSGWVHCSFRAEGNRQDSLTFDGTTWKKF